MRSSVALVVALACTVVAWAPAARPARRPLPLSRLRVPAQLPGLNDEAVLQSAQYYEEACIEEEACELPGDDSFTVAILGDLHLDPRKMEDYYSGRDHIVPVLQDAKSRGVQCALVSLGDLGESKSVRPDETDELFAGTTACHKLAADFLGSFDDTPYEVLWGNHDLEGIDEFATDELNLEMALRVHNKPTPQFCREVAEKTLLVGLSSTVFRDAKYTSHEVTVDDVQLAWFEDLLEKHSAEDGWKLFVFSHAPPIGSGLRVLQENHVINGCCWLNHSGGKSTRKFIELVRKHRCVKAWFSGHFHLGQDYQDSITFPSIPKEQGPYPNRGSCVFAQTSVMRSGTSRDKRQQSRLLRGNAHGFEICTVNHAAGGTIRLDATITYKDFGHEVGTFAHDHDDKLHDNFIKVSNYLGLDDKLHDNFIKVYSPVEGDGNEVLPDPESGKLDASRGKAVTPSTIAWWRLSCGRVLGIYDSRMLEYDPSTLAPLGLVVAADELLGRRVLVLPSGEERDCKVEASAAVGMEGADCAEAEGEEQAVLLVNLGDGKDAAAMHADFEVTVVQPNEDGSYWRKIVRNKITRMKEKRRMETAAEYAVQVAQQEFIAAEPSVVSSWGPYHQISGTAKNTGLAVPKKKVATVAK